MKIDALDELIIKIVKEHQPISAKSLYFKLDKLGESRRTEKTISNRLSALRALGKIAREGIGTNSRWTLPATAAHTNGNGKKQTPTLIPIPEQPDQNDTSDARNDQDAHEPLAATETLPTTAGDASELPVASSSALSSAERLQRLASLQQLFPPHWRMMVLQLDDETLAEIAEHRRTEREQALSAPIAIEPIDLVLNNIMSSLRPLIKKVIETAVAGVERQARELRYECDALREALDRQQELQESALSRERDRYKAELAQAEQREREHTNRIAALEQDVDAAMRLADEREAVLTGYRQRVQALLD